MYSFNIKYNNCLLRCKMFQCLGVGKLLHEKQNNDKIFFG